MSHKEYPKYGGLERNFKGKAMTEPKIQTEREKALRERGFGSNVAELIVLEVEAATRGLREQLEEAEAVVRLAYECGKGEQAWLASGEYLKKHGGE